MIPSQWAEFFAEKSAREKFDFVTVREYKIQFSSAILAQLIDLSRLRTIMNNGRFTDPDNLSYFRFSISFNARILFFRIPNNRLVILRIPDV
jgi:hypothetical protein